MKFLTRRFAVRAAVLFAAVGFSVTQPLLSHAAPMVARRFPVANGAVKYRMMVNSQMKLNGDITMTWVNFGARFRQDSRTNMSFGARKYTTNTWSIFDGKSFYSGMPSGMPGQSARKVAMKMTLPPNYVKNILMGGSAASLDKSRVVGHGMILGKPCEIRAINMNDARASGQVKMWLWQNLPLRTEMTLKSKARGAMQNMQMSLVATQLNTGIKPNPALFRLPAGITVQDMSAMQKQMLQAHAKAQKR